MSKPIDIFTKNVATAEAELLIFLLDGSGSMTEQTTFDGRSKVEHLSEIVKSLIERLSKSSKKPAFRVAFIYFSQSVIIEEAEGKKYFSIDDAKNLIVDPVKKAGGANTAIADAIHKIEEVLTDFINDEGIPTQKHATIFLFTDGKENVRKPEDVINEVKILTSNPISPTIACISFGSDADEDLLKKIASTPNDRQLRHLDMAQVLTHLPDTRKLFIQGHTGGEITQAKAEALRSFVETLSQTSKIQQKGSK